MTSRHVAIGCDNYAMDEREIIAVLRHTFVVVALTAIAGCAVVDTGATVVKAGATVVGTTVNAASTVASTTVDVGLKAASTTATVASATVSAASAAKAVTVAGASTVVAAGSLAYNVAANAANAKRADDVATVPVVAAGPDRFVAQDGRQWLTKNCADVVEGQPGLWVAMRSGDTEIRSPAGVICPVVLTQP